VAERYYGAAVAETVIDREWGIPYRELFQRLFAALGDDADRVIEYYQASVTSSRSHRLPTHSS
jgi:hypothetical protein